jgi:hypothetical protein
MRYLFVLVIAGLFFVGCGGDNKSNEENVIENDTAAYSFNAGEIETTPVENQNENFLLRYNAEKGKKFQYRVSSLMETDQRVEMPDTVMSQKVYNSVVYLLSLNMIDVDADSIIEAEVNVTSIKVEGQVNNNKVEYESRTMQDSASKANFSEYAALVNNPFRIRVTNTGDISEISRVDRLVNEFLKIKGYQDSVTAQEKDMLRRDMAEGLIRPLMVNIFRQLPPKNVARDSSWYIAQPPTPVMSFSMQNTYVYKIEGLEKMDNQRLAVVNAGVNSVFTGDNKKTEQGVTYTFQKPKTVAEGKIYFNLDKGVVQRSKTETTSSISFTMEANTPQGKQTGKRSEVSRNRNIVELLN